MPTQKNTIARELRAIQMAFRQLDRSFGRLLPALAANQKSVTPARPVVAPRRKMHITPARRAAMKLQGRYLGYMRQLKPAQKVKVKKIRAANGIRAAIAVAKDLSR